MGILDILRRVFMKDKKVVICGLDNSGKTAMVSFLQCGTFVETTPTMGKKQSMLEVQGVRINLVDLGGQKDFRSIWLGEMQNAECVIFMLDAHAPERFGEAKNELWKLAPILKKKSCIVMANKVDLQPVSSVAEIIEALDLMKMPSFEVFPISCKTGFGMVNAFSKIYQSLTGKVLEKKLRAKALTIFDKGGIPITCSESNADEEKEILKGGLLSAITAFVKEAYNSELSQLKLDKYQIFFRRTPHFMGSLILEDTSAIDAKEVEIALSELLTHLENMCPEADAMGIVDTQKVEFLVDQFATNIF